MPFYNDERLRRIRVGIDSYTNNELALDVIGNTNIFADGGLGINTTNTEGFGLYVDGDGFFTGVVTARTFFAGPTEITGGAFADDLTVTTLKVNGISTLGGNNIGAGETSVFIKENANVEADLYVGDELYVETSVGIGTTNPEQIALYVDGDGYFTGVVTATTFFAGPTEITGGAFADDLTVNTLEVTGVTTIGTGFTVGVGTTSIFIKKSANVEDNLYVGEDLYIAGLSTFVGVSSFKSDVTIEGDLYINQVVGTGGTIAFTDTANNVLGDVNTGAVQIDGGLGVEKNTSIGQSLWVGENIGVGSTQPTATLDVNGTLNVSGLSTFASDVDINASVDVLDDLTVNNNFRVVGLSTFQNDVNIGVGGTTAFFDVSTGYVGIGSTQPGSTLVVNSPSGYTGNILDTQIGGSSRFSVQDQTFSYDPNPGAKTKFHYGSFAGNTGWVGINYRTHTGPVAYLTSLSNSTGVAGVNNTGYFAWTSGTYFTDYNSWDLRLYRDDAGILAQRNETNPNIFRVYNTYTSSTNFERANVGWTTDVFIVGTEKGVDGGSPRQLELQTDGTTRVAITTDGYIGIGTTQPNATLTVIAPSGYTGRILECNREGNPGFSNVGFIEHTGAYKFNSQAQVFGIAPGSTFNASAGLIANNSFLAAWADTGGRRFVLQSVAAFGWNAGNFGGTGDDLYLYRDAADTLAQRRGTNAQTFRVYNTYTSSTNFERGQVGWTTNTFIVGTEKGVDGGTARQLELQTDGTTRVAITTTGNVGIGSTQPTGLLDVTGSFNSVLSVQDNSDGGKVVFRPSASSGLTDDGYGLELTTRISAGNAVQPKISEIGQYGRGQIVFSGPHNIVSFQGSGSGATFDFTDTRGNPTGNALLNNSGNIIRFVPGLYQITSKGNELNFVNDTNAQTFRVYNTYTSSTNFERANVGWTTNTFIVGTEKGSAGGTARQLELQTDETTRVAITTTGLVGIGSTQPTATLDVNGTLNVTGLSTFGDNVDINASVDISQTLNVTGVATFGNNVEITGDLTVNGNQTILNTQILEVEDINIGIASADPKLSDAALDGAGITIHGAAGDKTLTWSNADSRMEFNTTLYAPKIETDLLDVTGVSTFGGNVDINADLDVSGDAAIAGILTVGTASIVLDGTENSITVGTGASIYTPLDNILTFGTLDLERVRIDDGGNVGIGTTNAVGIADTNNTTILNAGIVTANFFFGSGAGLFDIFADAKGPDGAIQYNNDTNIDGATNFFYNDTTNRVGIGTSLPTTDFEVDGNINVTGLSTFNNIDVTGVSTFQSNLIVDSNLGVGTDNPVGLADTNNTSIINTGIVTANFFFGSGAGLFDIFADAKGEDGAIQYNNNTNIDGASDFFYDDVNLRVGIGSTVPTVKLDVDGDTNITGIVTAQEFVGIGSQLSNITFRQLSDVDGSNLVAGSGISSTPDYLVIYDPLLDAFRFVDPKSYFGINNDFNPDPIIVDYGSY